MEISDLNELVVLQAFIDLGDKRDDWQLVGVYRSRFKAEQAAADYECEVRDEHEFTDEIEFKYTSVKWNDGKWEPVE